MNRIITKHGKVKPKLNSSIKMNTRANKAVYSPRLHFPNIKLNPGHMLPV